jgi:hypothetical protein
VPLIYIAPDMAHFQLSVDQYAALIAEFKSSPLAANLKIDGDGSGTVTYRDVDFGWTYAPGTCMLTVVVIAKHHLAHWSSNRFILDEFNDKLLSAIA